MKFVRSSIFVLALISACDDNGLSELKSLPKVSFNQLNSNDQAKAKLYIRKELEKLFSSENIATKCKDDAKFKATFGKFEPRNVAAGVEILLRQNLLLRRKNISEAENKAPELKKQVRKEFEVDDARFDLEVGEIETAVRAAALGEC